MTKKSALFKNFTPLACLPGGGLLIMASGRLAHAITAAGALIWIYCLTSLIIYAGAKFCPQQGRTGLIAFLAAFVAAAYLFLLWLFSPLCALESFFLVSIIPLFYMASGVSKRFSPLNAGNSFFSSFFEALILGILIMIFAIIREPLGYVSLSLPGGPQGIILLFSFNIESLLPMHIIASSCGAFLLLGYFWGLYKYFKGDKNA
jgi:hypothetical protein